jgi:hypothetical protein
LAICGLIKNPALPAMQPQKRHQRKSEQSDNPRILKPFMIRLGRTPTGQADISRGNDRKELFLDDKTGEAFGF